MAALTNLLLGFFAVLFSYCMVAARARRQVLALTLAGVLAAALVGAPPAEAQGSLLAAIQSVLNVVNGAIKTALNSIRSVHAAINDFRQQVVWPLALMSQAKTTITEMIGRYRTPMRNISSIDLKSATLPNPAALESAMRDHQANDFASLATAFAKTYGALPHVAASPADRNVMDMDDALTVDSLKALKASDAASDLTLKTADDIENAASQAAPGSAPFLTAAAAAAGIESQALTQKMLATELRQEAARLAHENVLRKRGAAATGDVNREILNLLERR